MKKYLLIALGLIVATSATFAQAVDKEALKAQKAAQKEAAALVKKTREKFNGAIANPQLGRKETDYVKMQDALESSNQSIANELNKDNKEAWRNAADIEYVFYKKLEADVKTDESLQSQFLASAKRLADYCMKFDKLYSAEPKKNPEEFKKAHQMYQIYACNALIACLQAAQPFSTSDNQETLKMGVELCTVVADGFSSPLLADIQNISKEQKDEWILYAKIFRAQSMMNIKDSKAEDIENAYKVLEGTKFELTGYQALANYFRDRDQAKYVAYLQKGLAKAEGTESYPPLLFMLMQHQFTSKQPDECLKTIAIAKEKCANNDNINNAYLMEVQIYFEREQFKEAEQASMEGYEKFPDEPKFLMMAARSSWMYYARHTEDKAALQHTTDLFKKLEAENPDDPDLWGESLYILYNNSNQQDKAKAYKKYYKENK